MTLGLPAPLMRSAENRALIHAGHAAAFICLSVAIALGVISGLVTGAVEGWIGAGLVAAQAIALAVHATVPRVVTGVLALVVGVAAVLHLAPIIQGPGAFETTNNSVFALPRVALVLIGGAGGGTWLALAWAGAGWFLGELAALVGAAIAGSIWEVNHAALFAFVIVALVRGFDGLNRRFNGRRPSGSVAIDTGAAAAAMRHDFSLRASARLNETALHALRLVAEAGSGPIDDRLRQEINRDLGLAIGADWAAAEAGPARPVPSPDRAVTVTEADASATPRVGATVTATADPSGAFAAVLPAAFEAAAHAGLEVRVGGDPGPLRSLPASRLEALDSAVAQCLVNVARHAGVATAQLMVGGGAEELTVAVIDTGVGFDESLVPADRIGLRTSIRARVEQEGGVVRLWSKPSVGTTIVLTMPRDLPRGIR